MELKQSRLWYGICIVIGIAFSWAFSTQFAQAVQSGVNAPFFVMWFSTCFKMLLILPNKFCIKKYDSQAMTHPISVQVSSRESDEHSNQSVQKNNNTIINNTSEKHMPLLSNSSDHEYDHGSSNCESINSAKVNDDANTNNNIQGKQMTIRQLMFPVLFFYVIYVSANYSYVRALHTVSATQVTVLFSSCPAWVYTFSLMCLNESKFSLIKMFAVIICIASVIIITLYGNSSSSDKDNFSWVSVGSILSIVSAISAATYKVTFKRVFGDVDLYNVCKFLFCLGLFNALFAWIIVLILDLTNTENISILFSAQHNQVTWLYLIAGAFLGLMFDFLINFGIGFTYPLFVSLGTILGIPINMMIDIIVHGDNFNVEEYLGAAGIIVSFIILIVSDVYVH